LTFSPRVQYSAIPRAIPIMPSVATNGGTRPQATISPFPRPQAMPVASPASTAAGTPAPARNAIPSEMLASVSTEPTERSMPPPRITKVIPTARTISTADWSRMLPRLFHDRNGGAVIQSSAPSPSRKAQIPAPRPGERRAFVENDVRCTYYHSHPLLDARIGGGSVSPPGLQRLFLSVLVGHIQKHLVPGGDDLNVSRVGHAPQTERRAVVGRTELHTRATVRIDQPKEDGLRIGSAVRRPELRIRGVDLDARTDSALIVHDFQPPAAKDGQFVPRCRFRSAR